jgi:hypothetical protein
MHRSVVDSESPEGAIEARTLALEGVDSWSPDHANLTARAVARCPWHGSSKDDKVLVLAAALSRGIHPTLWFCTACHKGGIARLEDGRIRLEWNGRPPRRLGFRA